MMVSRLVWIRGLKGPEPQLWTDEYAGSGNAKIRKDELWRYNNVLAQHPVKDETASLETLAEMYPPPRT